MERSDSPNHVSIRRRDIFAWVGIIHAGNQTRIIKNRALISQSNYLDQFVQRITQIQTRKLDKDFIARTTRNIYAVKIISPQ